MRTTTTQTTTTLKVDPMAHHMAHLYGKRYPWISYISTWVRHARLLIGVLGPAFSQGGLSSTSLDTARHTGSNPMIRWTSLKDDINNY
jgi:hypothetical protein